MQTITDQKGKSEEKSDPTRAEGKHVVKNSSYQSHDPLQKRTLQYDTEADRCLNKNLFWVLNTLHPHFLMHSYVTCFGY